MASKALTKRQAQVDHLIGYIHTHAETTAKILTVRARRRGFAGPVPDLLNAQHFQAHFLREEYETLRRAESGYLKKKHQAPQLRRRRDERAQTLYDMVVALRGFLERVYGKPAAIRLTALEGRTPRDPRELAEAGLTVVDRLRAHGEEPPEPRVPGIDFRPEDTAAAVETLARELADTLRALDDWSREMDLLLVARNEARQDLDDLVTGTSEMLDGFYVAAGLRHLVPGIRTPGASMKRALRDTSWLSRRRAYDDLAAADRQNAASHAVRARDPVDESANWQRSADFRPGESRDFPPIPASAHPNSAPHAVRTRLAMDRSSSESSILRFEPPDPASHAVRRRHRGERGETEAVVGEVEEVGVGS